MSCLFGGAAMRWGVAECGLSLLKVSPDWFPVCFAETYAYV